MADRVQALYDGVRKAEYLALLISSSCHVHGARAHGDFIGLCEPRFRDNRGPCVNSWPTLWTLTTESGFSLGCGNGGKTAHNAQFTTDHEGHKALWEFAHSTIGSWNDRPAPSIALSDCMYCGLPEGQHAAAKCLFDYYTAYCPRAFRAYWVFPENAKTTIVRDVANLAKLYGGDLVKY